MSGRVVILRLSAAALVAVFLGCASSKTVDRKIAQSQARTDEKIESVEGQVEDLQQRQKLTDAKIEELGRGAAEALQRAQEAGVLARGRVVFQQTFSEDRVRFKVNSYDLSTEAKEALNQLATKVKLLEKGVYLEIQGHTDDTGNRTHNDMLGQNRAESVRRYLSRQHQLPLGRISTISYGDTLPIAPNKNAKGRAKNRRVVVVVLE